MVEWLDFESTTIRNFPMGDAARRTFAVYLPPSYSEKNKYPVIFFLPAWGNKASKYLQDDSVFGLSLQEQFDRGISSNQLAPFIGVFAEATSKLGSSQFVNSPSLGHYENYICDELVNLVDSKYSTYSSGEKRGIMGHSSGGYGALSIGMHRPDRFQYVASASGDSYFEINLMSAVSSTIQEIEKAGSIEKFLEQFLSHPNPGFMGGSKMMAMMMLSLAPCYAPRPNKPPLHGELFFDLKTGEIDPKIWQEYLEFDPVRMADRHSENLKKLKFVLLDCGLQDEYGAQWGHRQLYQKLLQLRVPCELSEFSGRHSGHNHRFYERCQKLLRLMTP